jgi:hypothetical protein
METSARSVENVPSEGWLGGRPVLRHAGERALAPVHDDVELDAVEVLLEQQVVAHPEDAAPISARASSTRSTSL